MKIIVGVIASREKSYYNEMIKLWKSYMHLNDSIGCYFLFNDPNLSTDYTINGDEITFKDVENAVPGIFNKSIKFMKLISELGIDYDYFIRTNLSSFWGWDRLVKFLEDKPTVDYIGSVVGIGYEVLFPSGAGFIMSKDVVKEIIEIENMYKDYINKLPDDVVYGVAISKLRKKIFPIQRFDINNTSDISKIPSDCFHIRNKWGSEILRNTNEIATFKKMLSKFYNIDQYYNIAHRTHSDINEHVPTLYKYAKECESVLECGVRTVVSSWGFAKGLIENEKAQKKLICSDLVRHSNINILKENCENSGIDFEFIEGDDLKIEIEPVDLVFIDTWHIYGHLKRELAKFKDLSKKYIIMHDTTIDEWLGESIRCGWNTKKQSIDSGYPENEICLGLWPAIDQFLQENKEWKLKERYINNNGLTILEKICE